MSLYERRRASTATLDKLPQDNEGFMSYYWFIEKEITETKILWLSGLIWLYVFPPSHFPTLQFLPCVPLPIPRAVCLYFIDGEHTHSSNSLYSSFPFVIHSSSSPTLLFTRPPSFCQNIVHHFHPIQFLCYPPHKCLSLPICSDGPVFLSWFQPFSSAPVLFLPLIWSTFFPPFHLSPLPFSRLSFISLGSPPLSLSLSSLKQRVATVNWSFLLFVTNLKAWNSSRSRPSSPRRSCSHSTEALKTCDWDLAGRWAPSGSGVEVKHTLSGTWRTAKISSYNMFDILA